MRTGAALIVILFMFSFKLINPGSYVPGDRARDFKLKNVNGKMVSLADFKDAKGFIVVFTCNHCPFSQAYEQRLIDLDKKYAAQGYPVIAINPNDKNVAPDDSYENMVSNAKEKGFTFPYLYDESQEIAQAYGAARTPHVFVLQKSAKDNIVKYVGAIDDNADEAGAVTKRYVEDAVNQLLDGKAIAVPSTKAVGCSIKWKKA